ncbi:MAG: hypothetical protein ACI9VR_003300, partial [Cognaticolwellia sp.]
SEADLAALTRLAKELEAVKPLAEEFDGELAIMSRLKVATDGVTAVRDQADQDLVYRALVFQGYAVARYFQGDLGSDPAAEGFRGTLNEKVVPQAWIDAAALDPARVVGEELLSEEAERLAFDEVRAQIQLAPKATVRVVGAPPGTAIVVDGGAPQSAALGVAVAPGRHWVRLEVDGESVARTSARVTRGQEWVVDVPAMASDLDLLAAALAKGPEALALQDRLARTLSLASHQPLHLVVQGKRGPLVYQVQGSTAVLINQEEGPREASLFSIQAAVGLGWMYDGDWYLSKPDRTAHTKASVNAVLPVGTLSAQLRPGPLALSLGVDVGIPVGGDNTLASGSNDLRLRAHPHIGFGVPVAQLTVGYLFPWHLGLGARAQIPIGESFSLGAATVYGYGLEQAQLDNPITGVYQPENSISAWGFLAMNFG